MTEENINRMVVTDGSGEAQEKTEEEIAKENAALEEVLQVGGEKEEKEKPTGAKEKLDPDVLAKLHAKKLEKEDKMAIKAVAKRDRSLHYGICGLGQAGGRIAACFYEKGYEACAMNTATQDLEHIRLSNNRRIHLPFGLGGAGKDLGNGQMGVEQNSELILEQINRFFSNSEMLLLAVSGGGGTGSGGAEPMISLLTTTGLPIGVIFVLPLSSDDALSKHNAVTTLGRLAKMASSDVITTLIVVDNARIGLLRPSLSRAEFWDVANNLIVEPLDLFNRLSSQPTPYDSLDPGDFVRIFTTGDCTIFGCLETSDYMEVTSIAELVLDQLDSSLLASDFDLKESRFGGIMVVGSPEVMKRMPAESVDYAMHMVSEACDYAQLTKGVYELEEMRGQDIIRIYTLFSGLGLPKARVSVLQEEAQKQMQHVHNKENSRASRMSVDYEQESVTSQTKEIHRMIKQKRSAFGKIIQKANQLERGGVIDRRKR